MITLDIESDAGAQVFNYHELNKRNVAMIFFYSYLDEIPLENGSNL